MAGEIKAAGFNSTVGIWRQMVEPAAFERFVDGLPPDQQQVIRRPHIATTWMPIEMTNAVIEAAHYKLFGGDDMKLFDAGRRQMKEDLSTLYRIFIRVASPAYVAARTAKIYATYARNAGTMSVVAEGDKFTDVRLDNYPMAAPSFWLYLRGNIAGALEMTRVTDVQVQIVEGAGKERFAVFHATWK